MKLSRTRMLHKRLADLGRTEQLVAFLKQILMKRFPATELFVLMGEWVGTTEVGLVQRKEF